jgi:hypothetical protein
MVSSSVRPELSITGTLPPTGRARAIHQHEYAFLKTGLQFTKIVLINSALLMHLFG